MKICAYVQQNYAKQTYKNECMDTRQFVGLRVIVDCLECAGYAVEYAGMDTAHKYDIVLVSLTSDCDWWSYIAERTQWQPGGYKVIIGGAGLLHIEPFLPFGDYFMFGRGENNIVPLIRAIETDIEFKSDEVAIAKTFNNNNIYHIAQVDKPYSRYITLSSARNYKEGAIGCNHKCLFCGYTWQRKFVSNKDYYEMSDSLFGGIANKERAILDMQKDYDTIDFSKLRTTAIDGFSERLRYMVNKKISKQALKDLFVAMCRAVAKKNVKPHQIKLYNICGLPTETNEDIAEFTQTLIEADQTTTEMYGKQNKQWSIVLHNTPFRPMPATPMACSPMSYVNYRTTLNKALRDKPYKGNIIYKGSNFWAVVGMGTDSLSTVILSAIAHRGNTEDTENIIRIARSKKFWSSNTQIRQATLERYFDVNKLFSAYTPQTLPSRYLRTYCRIDALWHNDYGMRC